MLKNCTAKGATTMRSRNSGRRSRDYMSIDPNLMLGIARAQFEKGEATSARTTLDDLIRGESRFRISRRSSSVRAVAGVEGNVQKAMEEYRVLASSYPGAEAAVRFAQLFKSQGRGRRGTEGCAGVLEQARIAPAHYRRAQKSWLDAAQRLA